MEDGDAGSAGRPQLMLHVFASDGSDKGDLLSPITDIFQAKIYRDYGAKPVSSVHFHCSMDYMHLRGRDPSVPVCPDPVNTGIHAERQYVRVLCFTLTASPLRTHTASSYLARNSQHYIREVGVGA